MVVWTRGYGRLWRLWKHSTYFLREAGFGLFLLRLPCIWESSPGVLSSVYSCALKLFSTFPAAHPEILDIISTSALY